MGIFALHRAAGAEHRDHAWCDCAQAGLIAGTVPTNGTLIFGAQVRQHDGRGGVAGDDDDVGRVRGDQFAHQRHHAGDQRLLAVLAIGEEGVIGDIGKIALRDARRPSRAAR